MPDPIHPFQHFPLTPSGEQDTVWLRRETLGTIRELIQDPHAWLRKFDRAPEQIFGPGKDSLLLQFLYPARGLAPGELLVHGIVDSNVLTVHVGPAPDSEEELLRRMPEGEARELVVTLHAGLAVAAHCPFRAETADKGLDLLAQIIQDPAAYFRLLNDPSQFRLRATAPQAGYTVYRKRDLPAGVSLSPPLHSLTGLRFLYTWNHRRGLRSLLSLKDACIQLMGTYDPEASGDVEEIQISTLSFAPELHSPGPVPPPAPIVRHPTPAEKESPSPEKIEKETREDESPG